MFGRFAGLRTCEAAYWAQTVSGWMPEAPRSAIHPRSPKGGKRLLDCKEGPNHISPHSSVHDGFVKFHFTSIDGFLCLYVLLGSSFFEKTRFQASVRFLRPWLRKALLLGPGCHPVGDLLMSVMVRRLWVKSE